MHQFKCGGAATAIIVALAGQAIAQGPAFQALEHQYPGVRVHNDGRVRAIYATPMTAGDNPKAAADAWLNLNANAFNAGRLELVPHFQSTIMNGKFTVFGYDQNIDGIPVENAVARVLVLNANNSVVYAGGTLAPRPAGGFAPPAVDPGDALATAQGQLNALVLGLKQWSDPELVVWQGETEWVEPVLAWKVSGGAADVNAEPVAHTYFINAATGEILYERNEIYTIDVNGSSTGMGSAGTLPDVPANPEVPVSMPNQIISIQGDPAQGITDVDGFFDIAFGGVNPITVTSNVSSGLWVNVNNAVGTDESVSVGITPPGPADLMFNQSLTEFTTSQVNAFHAVNLIHDYVTDRAPDFHELDKALPAIVNDASLPCNAFFTTQGGQSLNFMRNLQGCVNSAYSTVIAHEYGHFIVDELNLAQGAFGEGYGDTVSMLLYDVCVLGEGFFNGTGFIRNPCTANQQYPCGGEAHTCGQVIAGTWMDIRFNLGDTYGSQQGLDMAREMQVAWSLITTGGSGNNSAHPGTAIEVLTLDDDDGNLDNGTPNYDDICMAFEKHNIPCPALQLIAFEYPEGIPPIISPNQATSIDFNVVSLSVDPEPGSALAFASIDGGDLIQLDVTQNDANSYTLQVPALDCGQSIGFFLLAETEDGDDVTDPADAPDMLFLPVVATSFQVPVDDDFEADSGWTVGDAGDNATTGIWVRVNPVGTDAQPENDHSDPGTQCFVTGQGQLGGGLGDNDVDNGKTTLKSPVYDLAGADDVVISYWRWYSNTTGNAPNTDVFTVDVSNDAGNSWHNVEVVGPNGPETSGGWFQHTFSLQDIVAPTGSVMLRFIAEDDPSDGDGSLVEAAIDDLTVTVYSCEGCAADFNGDGSLDILDFVAFQTAFVAGDDAADFNGDASLDILDFVAFQTAFVAGCE